MNDHSHLIAVATFANSAEANLAKNRLEEMGISAVVAQATSVTVYGPRTTSLGSIKLMVTAEDAESASEYLRQAALREARRAEARARAAPEEAEAKQLSPREQEANHAYRCAVIGLFFWPLQLWTFFLLLSVVVAKEKLDGKPRRRAIWAGVIWLAFVGFFPTAILLSFLMEPSPASSLRQLPRPVRLVGKWTGKGTEKQAEFFVELELRQDGKLFYKDSGPPEVDCEGTWGYQLNQVLVCYTKFKKGDESVKGKILAWDLERCTDSELTLRGGDTLVQLVRRN